MSRLKIVNARIKFYDKRRHKTHRSSTLKHKDTITKDSRAARKGRQYSLQQPALFVFANNEIKVNKIV